MIRKTTGGSRLPNWGQPFSPFPFPTFSSLPLPSPSLPLPLEVGPLNTARGLGERCKLLQRVWGVAPAEIEFGAF